MKSHTIPGLFTKSHNRKNLGIFSRLELINGAKGYKKLQILDDAFDSMQCIPMTETTFLFAGKLGYELARKGHTLSAVDLFIAQTAIENGLSLMTYDEHFGVIAKRSTLTLFK